MTLGCWFHSYSDTSIFIHFGDKHWRVVDDLGHALVTALYACFFCEFSRSGGSRRATLMSGAVSCNQVTAYVDSMLTRKENGLGARTTRSGPPHRVRSVESHNTQLNTPENHGKIVLVICKHLDLSTQSGKPEHYGDINSLPMPQLLLSQRISLVALQFECG